MNTWGYKVGGGLLGAVTVCGVRCWLPVSLSAAAAAAEQQTHILITPHAPCEEQRRRPHGHGGRGDRHEGGQRAQSRHLEEEGVDGQHPRHDIAHELLIVRWCRGVCQCVFSNELLCARGEWVGWCICCCFIRATASPTSF